MFRQFLPYALQISPLEAGGAISAETSADAAMFCICVNLVFRKRPAFPLQTSTVSPMFGSKYRIDAASPPQEHHPLPMPRIQVLRRTEYSCASSEHRYPVSQNCIAKHIYTCTASSFGPFAPLLFCGQHADRFPTSTFTEMLLGTKHGHWRVETLYATRGMLTQQDLALLETILSEADPATWIHHSPMLPVICAHCVCPSIHLCGFFLHRYVAQCMPTT